MNERTNFIIAYLADLSGVQKNLKNLSRINSVIAKEFGDDFTKATKQIGDAIENVSKKTVRLKGGKEATEEITTLTTTVKTADGQLRKLVETQKRVDGALKSSTTAFKDASGSSKNFRQNLGELIKRAALTIPTWFLLRNAVRSVFVTIRDGFQSFVDFDRILQKSKRNLQGSATQIENDFKKVKKGIEDLALTTGESVVDIADAFQRFATLGFDAETSLAGATAATKLAVLQFDSLDNVANGLARTFKVLSKSFDEGTTDGENLISTVALLDELWKENAFDANELIGALQRFAPAASRLNISLEDSAKLLATLQSAAVVNTRAGRLLGRSFDELAGNISKVGRVLGLEVNPNAEGTVEIFLKVIRALEQLRDEEGFSPRLQNALQELFGGRIGREAVASLTSIREQLERNVALTGDVDKFNTSLQDVTDTVSRQAKRTEELKTAFQRAFVAGLVGGDDAVDTLKNVNKFLEESAINARFLGEAIRENLTFLSNLSTGIVTLGGGTLFKAFQKDIENASNEAKVLFEDINKALFGQLDASEVSDVLERAIKESTNNARNSINIEKPILDALENVKKRLESGEDLEVKFKAKDQGTILSEIEQQRIEIEGVNNLLNEQESITKSIISNELESLRASGATQSEILKAKTALQDQLGIRETTLSLLQRELDIEKAIKDERRLQNNLSSESLKLFKIAQSEGTNVARQISEVLSGDQDFDLFERRGGRALEVFKEKFGDIFESQQAERFFSGDRINGIRGGANITTRENFGRNPASFNAQAQLQQNRAFARLDPSSTTQRPQSLTQNNTINITNNVTANDPKQITDAVDNALKNSQSSTSKGIKNLVLGSPNIEF